MSADFTAPGPDATPGPPGGLRGRLLATLREPDTAKAAGLAGAMIANNVIALGSTFVFARLIGDYGSLAALISYLLILAVVGQAMQVATAREAVHGHLGVGEGMAETLISWSRTMLVFTVAMTIVSIALRQPIADLVGVKHNAWAAAAGLPAGCLYLEVSLLRGALQGIGDYKRVGFSLIGEQSARLVLGAVLAVAGLGLTGAYLGSLFSYVAMCVYCAYHLREQLITGSRRTPRAAALSLWAHVKHAWAPIAGLVVIALLQNLDLIVAKHRFGSHTASSYAATAVAAKVVIWVAMGAGFYLVPEVSRRAAGEDTRGVLLRALGIIGACAVPCLLIFAVAAHPLLTIGFSHKRATASSSLLPLGAAFTVLAATYLAVQYMLAVRRTWFLLALGAVAVAEPVLLLGASRHPAGFAGVVLAVQAVGAVIAFALALRRPQPAGPGAGEDAPTAAVAPTDDAAADRVAITTHQ